MHGVLPLLKKVMTASELLSLCKRVRSEVPLQTFALNCCVPETLSEVVLGSVSAAVASVTDHWDDNLPVLLVVGEDALKAIAQVVELLFLGDLRLKDARLDRGGSLRETIPDAKAARRLEEVVVGLGLEDLEGRRLTLHARVRRSGRVNLLQPGGE